MSVVKTGYALQSYRPDSGRLYGFSMWDRGDVLVYHSADNHENGGYWLNKIGEDDMLAHRIDVDEFEHWISDTPLPVYPVMFREWKDDSEIDIWFPTDLSHVGRDGIYMMTVYTDLGGHTAGSWNAMMELTKPAQEVDYRDLKERYEHSHNCILKPYQRWQPRFTEELDKQAHAE